VGENFLHNEFAIEARRLFFPVNSVNQSGRRVGGISTISSERASAAATWEI